MADTFTAKERSAVMRAVAGSGTTPERVVEAIVRQLRFRPKLNDESLPGKPDLVFPRRKKTILVHGCFWHRHACDAGRSTPETNRDYWLAKFERNVRRDKKVRRELRAAGWSVLVVWECQTKRSRRERLKRRIASFLAGERPGKVR
jgi:DNA mismatch endonuclease (patch repair protein)